MKIDPSSGPHAAYEAISERLESFSAYLTPRYESLAELPGDDSKVGRWVAKRISDGAMCLITIVQYGGALLTQEAVDAQQALALRMDAYASPRLGKLLEWRCTAEAHFMVCTIPGAESLHGLLGRRHALPHAEVWSILKVVAAAVEDAATAGFPFPVLDPWMIFLSESESVAPNHGLQLPLPPLPGTEALGWESGPAASSQAVRDLASLSCDLLGMPVGGTRFRPVPHLPEMTNHLLVAAIDGNSNILAAGPVAFAEAFGGE